MRYISMHSSHHIRRLVLPAALLAAVLLGAVPIDAANILLVVNSFSDPAITSNANDQEVLDRLTSQGHTVTLADDDTVSVTDTTGKDLILISSSVSSTAAGLSPLARNTLKLGRVPVICYEPGLYDELGFQLETTYGNASGHTSLAISAANHNHPLAAGKSGTIDIVEPGLTAAVSSSALPYTIGSDAIVIATNATPDIDVGRISIWAYDAGSRLADNTTVVPSRRVALFYNATTDPGVYNTNAIDLFNAAVQWALEPPANKAPVVAFTQPANGMAFPAGANISLAVNATDPDGSVARVEYYAGTNLIGQATASPFGFTWNNVPTGRYQLYAQAVDNGGLMSISETITVVVGTPLPEVLLIVGASPANASETAIKERLEAFNFAVRIILAGDPVPSYVTNQALILVSSSVTSDAITKYRDVPVPIINWEWAAYDGLGMADADGATLADQTQIEIVDASHPLAAGLPAGLTTVFTLPTTQMAAGTPVAGGTIIANAADGSGMAVLFAFDQGTPLSEVAVAGLKAPARRVGFFLGNDTFTSLNTDGLKLFDAAVAWGLNRPPLGTPPTVAISAPVDGSTFTAGTKVVLTATAADADGQVVRVEFFAGTNKVGEATSSPFTVTWANAPTGAYAITAKATDSSGYVKTSSPINIVIGNPPQTVLLVVGNNPTTLNANDSGVKAHLESFGFQVQVVGDAASTTTDAQNKVLVMTSSTVSSGNVADKFRMAAVPVINFDHGLEDNFLMTWDSGVDHGETAGQTEIIITDASHPLAAGLSEGMHTVTTTPLTFTWGLPDIATAKVIATLNDGTSSPCLYAYGQGAFLIDGVTPAPARRVHTFSQNDGFPALTADGLKLFDAALSWALNQPLSVAPPRFNPPVWQSGNLTLSWTGTGTLEQADQVNGKWTDAPDQTNPQTLPMTATMRYYRLRR